MKSIFVDTSARDALADQGDPNHSVAMAFRDEIAGQRRLVVTNYILDELYTLLLLNIGYQRAVDFKRKLDILARESILQVEWVSEELASEAWSVFEKFNVDKQWSFTDCVSYVVMRRLEMVMFSRLIITSTRWDICANHDRSCLPPVILRLRSSADSQVVA